MYETEEKKSLADQLFSIASNARNAGRVSEIRLIERVGSGEHQIEQEVMISYDTRADKSA